MARYDYVPHRPEAAMRVDVLDNGGITVDIDKALARARAAESAAAALLLLWDGDRIRTDGDWEADIVRGVVDKWRAAR